MYSTSSVSSVTALSLVWICLNLVSSSHLISHSALTSVTWQTQESSLTQNSPLIHWMHTHTRTHTNTDLVSIVGLVGEAEGHTEGVIVVLQEGVSVLTLVQSGHGDLELLQPRAQVLLVPPPTWQVGLHHPAQRDVVPCICTLREAWTMDSNHLYN